MPVVRVDEEVWRELQKRAEPLVDTPNSVLRKTLGLGGTTTETEGRFLDIELSNLHSPRSFGVILIPRQKRLFFPGYKVDFELESDIGAIRTRVTSAPRGTPVGDPNGGAYIQGNLKPWYRKHTELKQGDKLRFELLEPGKRYKLSTFQGEIAKNI